jgi:RNA polymerase sigma-70 factor (ECF subfamily)
MKLRLAISRETTAASKRPADVVDALYERHQGKVKRWARQLSGPGVDLEDLVHDVFLIAFRKGFHDRGEATIDTWLFRITHREVQARRRRIRIRQLLLRRNQDELVPLPPDTPLQEIERSERHARLYRALDRLSDRDRTALILFEVEELSGEQIAERTGASVGAIWVRLHRARTRLLELLAREDPT